jgi:hypothetical protein
MQRPQRALKSWKASKPEQLGNSGKILDNRSLPGAHTFMCASVRSSARSTYYRDVVRAEKRAHAHMFVCAPVNPITEYQNE